MQNELYKQRALHGLKPMHNIDQVSVNASILYNNQEICNTTNV